MTFERADLPHPVGMYEVATNEDHIAFLYDIVMPESDELWAHDYLRGTLYTGALGDLSETVILFRGDSVHHNLQEYLTEHADCKVGIEVGSAADVDVFVFTWPTRGWRFWRCLHNMLVASARFDMSSMRQPSRWMYMLWPTWERFLGEVLADEGLRRSSAYNASGSADHWRCLRGPSVNGPALFALFARLGTAPRHLGGFRDAESRTRACFMFELLLRRASIQELRVVAAENVCLTAGGFIAGDNAGSVVSAMVGQDLRVNMNELRAGLQNRDLEPCKCLRVLLSATDGGLWQHDERPLITDFVKCLFLEFHCLGHGLERALQVEWDALQTASTPARTRGGACGGRSNPCWSTMAREMQCRRGSSRS